MTYVRDDLVVEVWLVRIFHLELADDDEEGGYIEEAYRLSVTCHKSQLRSDTVVATCICHVVSGCCVVHVAMVTQWW